MEFAIKGAFDNIDHELLMKAVRTHVKERWMILYIQRWPEAPFVQSGGTILEKEKGIPQGGVISRFS